MSDTPETREAYTHRDGESFLEWEIRRAQTMEKLERERNEAREQYAKAVMDYGEIVDEKGKIRGWLDEESRDTVALTKKLRAMTEERDRLAEALKGIASGLYSWQCCVDEIAPQALITMKGETNE